MFTVIGKSDNAKRLAYFLNCEINNINANIAIRYGSINAYNFPIIVNNNKAVGNASNKYKSLKYFHNVGLPVPPFSTTPFNLPFPILGRKFYHSKGKDIIVIKNIFDFKKYKSDYYITFIPVKDEYRVHIVCGMVVNTAIKVGGDCNVYCRNLKTGWTFKDSKLWKKNCPFITDMAKIAVECLGLDFGAVDIIISKNGNPYVLEVNTAPGLIDRRAKIYAEVIYNKYAKLK